MSNKDEFDDIPPLVPSRDQVDTHLSNRRSQGQEIVNSGYKPQLVKVSTWPVRILLTLIIITLGGAGYGGYLLYGEYENDLRQADLRIADLERRLALVGESSEESTFNIIERMDFNFSEIDKLWAARRVINTGMEDLQSEIAKLGIVNSGQDEAAENLSRQVTGSAEAIQGTQTSLATLNTAMDEMIASINGLDGRLSDLASLQADIESIRVAMNSGDNNLLGLAGRLEYVEQSMESVNAHRLQINETLFRLQENIETLQSTVSRANGL